MKRLIAAYLFWIAFTPFALVALLSIPFLIPFGLKSDVIDDWIYRVGKALDQIDNAAYFSGHSKESISSHCGRWALSGKAMPWNVRFVIWLTNIFETNHCVKAIEEPFRNMPL